MVARTKQEEYKRFFDETPVAMLRTDLATGKFLMALISRIKSEGQISNYEIEVELPNRERKWLSISMHINCGGTCIEGCAIDVTDRKKLEAELSILKNKQLDRLENIKSQLDERLANF